MGRMNRASLASYFFLAFAVLVLGLALYWKYGRGPESTDDGLADLEKQLETQEQESDAAVKAYHPKITGNIDDLAVPADELLRSLPGVVEVKAHRPVGAIK